MNFFVCPICRSRSYGNDCRVEVCRGNSARYGLYAARHGVRVVYRGSAYRVDGTGAAGRAARFQGYFDRRFRDAGNHVRHAIRDEIAGYCLDAPDDMPAGGCRWESVKDLLPDDPDPNPGYPAQMTVSREGEAGGLQEAPDVL